MSDLLSIWRGIGCKNMSPKTSQLYVTDCQESGPQMPKQGTVTVLSSVDLARYFKIPWFGYVVNKF